MRPRPRVELSYLLLALALTLLLVLAAALGGRATVALASGARRAVLLLELSREAPLGLRLGGQLLGLLGALLGTLNVECGTIHEHELIVGGPLNPPTDDAPVGQARLDPHALGHVRQEDLRPAVLGRDGLHERVARLRVVPERVWQEDERADGRASGNDLGLAGHGKSFLGARMRPG